MAVRVPAVINRGIDDGEDAIVGVVVVKGRAVCEPRFMAGPKLTPWPWPWPCVRLAGHERSVKAPVDVAATAAPERGRYIEDADPEAAVVIDRGRAMGRPAVPGPDAPAYRPDPSTGRGGPRSIVRMA